MDPITLMVSFLIFICVVAVLIIGARWILSLTGWAIPQPLMVILGIIAFVFMLVFFLDYAGLYHPGFFHPR